MKEFAVERLAGPEAGTALPPQIDVAPGYLTSASWLALLVALLFSAGWTKLALPRNNLDRQGIDIVMHAILIHEISEGVGNPMEGYPQTSHRVAALFMPLFDGNAIQALRCAALLALLVMLIAQYQLLRRALPTAIALLVLVAWQFLCSRAKVADVNHFLFEGQYNYSRAVGAAALWLILLFFVAPVFGPSRRWLNDLLAIGLASFCWCCHLTPGAIAFGTLGVLYVWAWTQGQRRRAVVALGLAALAAAISVLGSSTLRCMGGTAACDSWLPIAWQPLLMLWVPTWFVALGIVARGLWQPPTDQPGLVFVLASGLVVSGALQGYLMVRLHVFGTIGPYAVKTVLFTTFALASMLWLVGLAGLARRLPEWRWLATPRGRLAQSLLAGAAALYGLAFMLGKDMRRPHYGPERDIAHVVRVLSQQRQELAGCYYFDRDQPFGSFFASTVGLRSGSVVAGTCFPATYNKLREPILDNPAVVALLLPDSASPASLGMDLPCKHCPPFWRFDLAEVRAARRSDPAPGIRPVAVRR